MWASEIRFRAEAKAGELLRKMEKTGERRSKKAGRPRKSVAGRDTSVKLHDLGISRSQSWRWQELGERPRADPREVSRKKAGFDLEKVLPVATLP